MKKTRLGRVATSLGEEDRDAVVGGILLQEHIPRLVVVGVAAPLVGIEREEVKVVRTVSRASHVILQVRSQFRDVGCRVANRDIAVALVVTVRLHIAGGRLDIGCSNAVRACGQHLVSNEETSDVVIALESIHDLLVCRVLTLCPCRRRCDDVCGEGVQIDPSVDSCVGERAHAAVVVGRRVYVVHADGVGAEGLHEGGIELTLVGVRKRVVIGQLVGRACATGSVNADSVELLGYTLDVELLAGA